MRSINIFGITGGIGYHFFKEIVKSEIDICGFYHNNHDLANRIKKERSGITLKRVDLSRNFAFKEIIIPNYECLLYVAGKYHFSKNIFDFSERDLETHMNININSLFVILQRLCSYDNLTLKKVVVVSAMYPLVINSLYHTVKRLQDEFLEILKPTLNDKQIGLSIIKVGWVNTNMYKEYMRITGKTVKKVIEPDIVAKCCLEEFEQNQRFNVREVKS
ncbi:MAG: SDR family NAD(P)-dependent oxidoreductase [Candidatus Nealsonbacteria bacterium]